MRIVSLVPSWTETLIECGADVVGRTRFCIHPKDRVSAIPVVGGTKQVRWTEIARLAPDLLVLDREENTLEIAERSPFPTFATRVLSVPDAALESGRLAERTGSERLRQIASRWSAVAAMRPRDRAPAELPGVLEWIRKPDGPIRGLLYLIWRDPWMAVSADTFIGSVLRTVGYGWALPELGSDRYPIVKLEDFDPGETLLLLSSEPYRFERRVAEMRQSPFPSALVDGECYSWFGVRALRFLESELGVAPGAM
jgi:hypothetical protein